MNAPMDAPLIRILSLSIAPSVGDASLPMVGQYKALRKIRDPALRANNKGGNLNKGDRLNVY
jgi:hypothetical protein